MNEDGSKGDKIVKKSINKNIYDSNSNLVSFQQFNKKGKVIHEEKYSYKLDAKGSWVEMYKDGVLYRSREIAYK